LYGPGSEDRGGQEREVPQARLIRITRNCYAVVPRSLDVDLRQMRLRPILDAASPQIGSSGGLHSLAYEMIGVGAECS